MRPWNKRNVTLKIEEMEKTTTPIYAKDNNLDRAGKGKDSQRMNVYGATFVNELGTQGSFETATSGLADAFDTTLYTSAYQLVTDALFGDYAQQITADGTQTTARARINNIFTGCGSTGDQLYISCYGKTSHNFKIIAHAGTEYSHEVESNGNFVKCSLVATIGDLSSDYLDVMVSNDSTLAAGETGIFDGLQIINLTKLGYLPVDL